MPTTMLADPEEPGAVALAGEEPEERAQTVPDEALTPLIRLRAINKSCQRAMNFVQQNSQWSWSQSGLG